MEVTTSVKPRNALFRTGYPLATIHCYRNPADGKWWEPGMERECLSWRGHDHARGVTGFVRFIHAVGRLLTTTDLMNPFVSSTRTLELEDEDQTETTFTWICHEGQPLRDRLVYCEVYLLSDGRGTRPVYKVFLDRDDKVEATIECYDDRYVEISRMAAAAVAQAYKDEEAS